MNHTPLHQTRPIRRPSRVSGELTILEARFVRCYVGEARGNGRHAARLAGYQGSLEVLDVQAARLLRRPRVREAIGRAVETETERRGLTRDDLVRKAYEIMVEGRPFERVKAAELLAKLNGWFAPTHHVTARLPPQEGPATYAALVETLRSYGEGFTPQEREAMRKELLQVIAEATKAVELLGTHEGN